MYFCRSINYVFMDKLKENHIRLVEETPVAFGRCYLDKLPWDDRLLGLKGFRGVGKTTLMLQYIKKHYGLSEKALYISLDDLFFTENRLTDFAEDFIALGGEHLFIDEVHKYPSWSVELKNIYDSYKNLKITFSGSSLLEIINSRVDLSRRALVFLIQGLSFREYLNFRFRMDFPVYDLEEILKNHTGIALSISKKIKPLKYFNDYLRNGYFPFFNETVEWYHKRLQEVFNMIIEFELPALRGTNVSIVPKIKLLLYIIGNSVPFKPNISTLAGRIESTRKTVLEYISYLKEARILNAVYKDSLGLSLLKKPDKLFLENTNFSYAISHNEPNTGNLRETFFLNQLTENHLITEPDKGDFLVDDKYLFEIGGKNKSFSQIAGNENGYLALDGLEFSTGNRIPLWLFGFLY